MPRRKIATDTVSALLYDAEKDEFCLVQAKPKSPWRQVVASIKQGEHPILALRRSLADIGVPLPDNTYYYLQTLIGKSGEETTQYLVLYPKNSGDLTISPIGQARWFSAHDVHTKYGTEDKQTHVALSKFRHRFGADVERKNLVHMMHLAARS